MKRTRYYAGSRGWEEDKVLTAVARLCRNLPESRLLQQSIHSLYRFFPTHMLLDRQALERLDRGCVLRAASSDSS
jgi:hypothetical protein